MKRTLRRHATTIALTFAAATALVLLLVVDRGSVSTNEASMRKKNLFDAWRIDDVTAVTLRAHGHATRLVRAAPTDAGQRPWDVEIDGARHAAEEQVADQLLGTLEFAVAERRVAPEAVDRKVMGLDQPIMTVDVEMAPLDYALAIGGPAASSDGARYAEVKGKGVFVVSRALVAAIDVRPEQLRSRHFVPYFSVDLAAIDLDGVGGARRLVRAPWSGSRSPAYRFAEGGAEGGVRVSPVALDRILTALGEMSAEAFLTAEEEQASSRPEVTVTLVPTDTKQPTASIAIGGACPRRAELDAGADASREGEGAAERVVAVRSAPTHMAVCVPKAPAAAFGLGVADLVDLRVVGAPADEVTEIAIASGDRKLDLARSGAEWHVRAPDDRRVDAEAGRLFLGGLLGIVGTGFAPGHATGAKSTARIISLRSGEARRADLDAGPAERVEELAWGDADGDDVYVRRAEDGAILVVPAARMAPLSPSDLPLRSRKIVDESLSDLRAVRVEGGGHAQRVERRGGAAFELVEPKVAGAMADAGLTSDLAQALATLTADRWIAEKDDGSHGLASPTLVLTGEFRADESSAPRTVKIDLGAPTDAGFFAAREGTPGVFVAPYALAEAAKRWLVDRGALAVDAGEITAVSVERGRKGGKPLLRAERRGEAWTVDVGALPAGTDAAALRDVIAELAAEEAVTVGKARREEGLDPPSLVVRVARAGAPEAVLAIGAGDTLRGVNVVYARREGVDATFAVARDRVKLLLDAAR